MNQNIFSKLKKDHTKLKAVMRKLASAAKSSNKKNPDKLFQKFKDLYSNHDALEDEVIYPNLKKHKSLEKLILKGYQAHHMVEMGILELRALSYSNENWGPKFLVIRDSILMHIAEEEKLIFPKAKRIIKKDELQLIQKEAKGYK